MARLKSGSRSRKPGLISRPQQLLSSSCITPNRWPDKMLLPGALTSTQSPPKTAPASAVVRILRTSSPDFPDLNADGLEYLDLTNDASESSDSLPFNSDPKLCREDYGSRPNLVASGGRKRKSSEISEEEFNDLGDFPAIYELPGTYSPTSSPGNRSGTRRRDGSRGSRTRRTRDGFKNHLSTEISPIIKEDEDEILSPSRYVHCPLAREQFPRKPLPVVDTQHPSKGATSPLKESAVNSEASNPVSQTNSLPPRMEDGRDEPFIPDSDGESLMPPSHNSSIVILKASTNKPAHICTHAGPTAMPAIQPDSYYPNGIKALLPETQTCDNAKVVMHFASRIAYYHRRAKVASCKFAGAAHQLPSVRRRPER
ncbi:hypothetical protein Forpi1262_v017751 [Fusarium oxysporum f. sp. raphani]|uniref:Uncharacterized protein n=1 Tax=Fusarium oxysporum f. sp. raphani TaxID=96318 RepID=A0A8J5P167_FUSOX|nr:hypothetical protein Forpi1262_v017751 [Fusarium oxysporum f. sp. raphani]